MWEGWRCQWENNSGLDSQFSQPDIGETAGSDRQMHCCMINKFYVLQTLKTFLMNSVKEFPAGLGC